MLRQKTRNLLEANVKKCWRCDAEFDPKGFMGKYRGEVRCKKCGLIITTNTTGNKLLGYALLVGLYASTLCFCIGFFAGVLI